ncbi:MAG: MBL fold metallo-hydrolase [Deinococcales bacterium]
MTSSYEPDIPLVEGCQSSFDCFILDTQHMGNHGTVGSFLIPSLSDERFLLIETGPGSTLPTLNKAIEKAGFALEHLAAILVTHIHLDHAGAAGALAQASRAEVYVHELGARHLIDPSRLMESARRIYGERLDSLWGEMKPIEAAKLHSLKDHERLKLLGHDIRIIYSPGHASHHLSYLVNGELMFTGDSAGAKVKGSKVVRPTLPPPEVDLETYDVSVNLMKALQPKSLLLTHFGQVLEPEAHFEAVKEVNHRWAEDILQGLKSGEDDSNLALRIAKLSADELLADGASEVVKKRHSLISNDEMSASGLKRYWQKFHPEKL